MNQNPYESPKTRGKPAKWPLSKLLYWAVIVCALAFLAASLVNAIILWVLGK